MWEEEESEEDAGLKVSQGSCQKCLFSIFAPKGSVILWAVENFTSVTAQTVLNDSSSPSLRLRGLFPSSGETLCVSLTFGALV